MRHPTPESVRRGLACLLAAALALPPASIAGADTYPSRPIKLVVAQAPGGHNDTVARIVAARLEAVLDQQVVIENRGGVGGTIGAEFVARAAPDGYTLLLGGSNNLAIAMVLDRPIRYDVARDFLPVGGVARVPYSLAIRASLPVATVAELVAYARAHPGRLTYGSGGAGSTSNLASEWLKASAGVDIVHVPYRGTGPAVLAILNREIDMVFTDLGLALPHAQAGTLRILAVAGAKRAAAAPGVPTVAEQGIPGFDIAASYGLVVPAGTPAAIVARLNDALRQVLQAPDVRARFAELGFEPIVDTPAQFGALIRSETARYADVIHRTGIKSEP